MNFNEFLNNNDKYQWLIYRPDACSAVIHRVDKLYLKISKHGTSLRVSAQHHKLDLGINTEFMFLTGEEVSRILNNDETCLKNVFSDQRIQVDDLIHVGDDLPGRRDGFSPYVEISTGIGLFLAWLRSNKKEPEQVIFDFDEDRTVKLNLYDTVLNNYNPTNFTIPLNGAVTNDSIKTTLKKITSRKFQSLEKHLND